MIKIVLFPYCIIELLIMWPFLDLRGFLLPTYNVCLAFGVLVSFFVAMLIVRRRRMTLAFLADYFFLLAGSAFVWARVLEVLLRGYALSDLPFFWQDTGFNLFGGIVGGAVALLYASRRAGESFLRWADVLSISGVLLLLFHHLGTFFAGTEYGVTTSLPWGVTFSNPDSAVLTNLPIHPTQLYGVALTLCVFIIGVIVLKNSTANGRAVACVLLTLFGGEFLLEFLYDDSAPAFLAVRMSQWLYLALVAAGMLLAWYEYRTSLAMRHSGATLEPAATNPLSTTTP